MTKSGHICLTFDLEEFDLPLEYKQKIEKDRQIEITTKGMEVLLPLLKDMSCTFFTTAYYAENCKDLIKNISYNHEIASHGYYHSSFKTDDLKASKKKLEEICGEKIFGFRMPRMANVNYTDLKNAGFLYDSSINPTLIPGRYNNFSEPKTIFKKEDLIIFPVSVTPNLRIPLFWLTFKNSNIKWYCKQVQKCLDSYGYVNIYFHPWEFTDISDFKLPEFMRAKPDKMKEKLNYFIEYFKDRAHFTSVYQLLKSQGRS